MTDKISTELNVFYLKFKFYLNKLMVYLPFIIAFLLFLYLFKNIFFKYLFGFFQALPEMVMNPKKFSLALISIIIIIMILYQTIYLTTGAGLHYYLYKLNLI